MLPSPLLALLHMLLKLRKSDVTLETFADEEDDAAEGVGVCGDGGIVVAEDSAARDVASVDVSLNALASGTTSRRFAKAEKSELSSQKKRVIRAHSRFICLTEQVPRL